MWGVMANGRGHENEAESEVVVYFAAEDLHSRMGVIRIRI